MTCDKNFILLDVRTPEEFASRHIPGAVQLTYLILNVKVESGKQLGV